MNIDFVSGYQANVQIKDLEDNLLFEKEISSPEEMGAFLRLNAPSKKGWSIPYGCAFPQRTQNLKDFSKDFFLPTFVNFALKVNNIAIKVIASIFAIALDIVTFPVRFFATPFRFFYNLKHPEEKHLITQLIHEPKSDVVNLVYKIQNNIIENPAKDGISYFAKKSSVEGFIPVALKRMPGEFISQSFEREEGIKYTGLNGKWCASAPYSFNEQFIDLTKK